MEKPETRARSSGDSLNPEQALELFRFYEEAAEKAKAHAWSQTTWILTLNAAILGFSVSFYADHSGLRGYFAIELLACGVGSVLCGFLLYLLNELGGHIRHHWASSNRIAAGYGPLTPFLGKGEAATVLLPGYEASFPAFCRRLQMLAALFLLAHLGWAAFVAYMTGS